MTTLLQMRTNIATDLKRSGISSDIDRAINKALQYYETEDFWFSEKTGTFSTVANQQSYTTSDTGITDILKINKMTVTKNNIRYVLNPRTFQYIRDINGNTSYKAYPADYALWADKIWLYPTPDAVYTITVDYLQKFSDVSADGDENDLMIYGNDLIECRARYILNRDLIEDDAAAQKAQAAELEALAALQKRNSQYRATNTLRPWS